VATEPKRIALHLDADPRFAAAAGGAVRCLGELSGMSEEDSREFQAEMIQACLAAFESHNTNSHLIEFTVFEDRLEVVVDSNVGNSAIRLSRHVISQH
jgi:hypothetical protein